MKERAVAARRSDRASLALAVLGGALALLGGVLLYARENIFDTAELSSRAQSALSDERVRLALAQPVTDAILDNGPSTLVNARPLIESVVTGALGTPPVKAAFGEAVESLGAKLFDRSPDTLALNLADVAAIAAQAVEAVSPRTAAEIPRRFRGARLDITESIGSIRTLQLAESVRVGGLLLPPLALLALLGAVFVAEARRAAVLRVGLVLAAAAITGLVLLAIGHALLLSRFDDDLVSDAVAAIWDAFLADLRAGMLIAAVLSTALAAAARFARGGDADPLAPLAWAARALRARPRSAFLAAVRGLVLGAVGLALILVPGVSLEVVAILAGAWLLYVGISELLAMLAPLAPRTAEAGSRRRVRLRRVAAIGAAAAVAAALVILISAGDRDPARPAGPPAACNGSAELCALRLDQVAFPSTHNSMSAAQEPGWFLPNQRYGIRRQLEDGIRGLLIDTHYGIRRGTGRGFAEVITDLQKEQKTRQEIVEELGEPTVRKAEDLVGRLAFDGAAGDPEPYLCHVLCELGATRFDRALAGIEAWMQANPDEFLIIFIEDVISPGETAAAFEGSGLLRYAYRPEKGVPPPTLGELIEGDRRLLVMAENDAGGGRYPWYQQGFDLVQETPYTFGSVAEIESPESCRPNRGHPDDPLFLINNWIEKIPRDPGLAAEINSRKVLLGRSRRCERIRGLAPNLLAVDYYDRGNVFGVANMLNGLPHTIGTG